MWALWKEVGDEERAAREEAVAWVKTEMRW